MSVRRLASPVSAGLALVPLFTALASAQTLRPRPELVKPERFQARPGQRNDVIRVKFLDDSGVRLRGGALTDLSTGTLVGAERVLARFAGGRWEKIHSLDERRLEELRRNAESTLGRAVADPNVEFFLHLPEGIDAPSAIDAWNALPVVEMAWSVPTPPRLPSRPLPPDYQANQGYLGSPAGGIFAQGAWSRPGGTGAGYKICDLEYSWDDLHDDLPAITLLGPTPVDPDNDPSHGTGVLGEMLAQNNGWGATGAAYDATGYFAGVITGPPPGTYNLAGAITTALGTLGAGDVILIEQQMAGPNWPPDPCCANQQCGAPPVDCDVGLVASEWDLSVYNAIVAAVGNNVIVVEAAGNGSQNLDAPEYSVENGGHWPFLPANDSGAIIVGAGASPGGSDVDRSRLGYSNYGATLDLQGWGQNVVTTGTGDLYNAEGLHRQFTAGFSGTSSASPIVAAACVLTESLHAAAGGGAFIAPATLKSLLQATGSPQQNGTHPVSERIGPRPNVMAGPMSEGQFVPFCTPGSIGVQACPCGNNPSGPNRGCDNSAGTGGASIGGAGAASVSADTLVITGTNIGSKGAACAVATGNVTCLLVQWAQPHSTSLIFHDGVRCVAGALKRIQTRASAAGVFTSNDTISAESASHGDVIAPGSSRYYMVWHRDACASFCPSATANVTNNLAVHWVP